nr:DUF4331 family protein [Ktedonobacterales bacterium]
AGDPFYIDPTVLKAVGTAFTTGQRVDLGTWRPETAVNLFANTTINALVLEVPDGELDWRLPPDKRIHVWGTSMLATDAGGWHPINRAGHPMIQPIFHAADDHAASHYNTTVPADDRANYGAVFAQQVAAVVAAHGTVVDATAYGAVVVARLLPDMLPYQVGSPASYSFAGQNGRTLTDNTPDILFSLVTNSAFNGGLSPKSVTSSLPDAFPYVAPAEA